MTTTDDCPWQELWDVAVQLAERLGGRPESVLDPIGLLLVDPAGPAPDPYWCTPSNSVTFAETGGDGVHYGVVSLDGQPGPIVMTVPMNPDHSNLVVGSSMRDFLSLGCHFGYFVLEQPTYEPLSAIRDINDAVPDDGLLAELTERFGLSPWSSVAHQLAQLNTAYAWQLEIRGTSGHT